MWHTIISHTLSFVLGALAGAFLFYRFRPKV